MQAKAKKRKRNQPTPKQLRARRAFARMAKQRAKEARAAKRAAARVTHRSNRKSGTPRKTTRSRKSTLPPRARNGRFTKKPRRRNVEGFRDSSGFHPIRAGEAYDERRAGERPGAQLRAASRARKKAGRPARRGTYARNGRKPQTQARGGSGRFTASRRRNSAPPESLTSLYQEFQGRPISEVLLVDAPPGTPDELVMLGVLDEVTYETVKDHLDGELVQYVHEFGEEGGEPPLLCADGDGNLYVVGGDYTIATEGIRD